MITYPKINTKNKIYSVFIYMANPSFYHTKNYNPDAKKIDFVIWGQYKGNENSYPTITQIDIGKFSHGNPENQSSEPETLEIKNISFPKRSVADQPIDKGKYEEVQIGEEFNKCIKLLLESNQQQETKHRVEKDFDLKNSSGNFLLWGHIENGFMSNVSGKFSMKDPENTLSILNAKITDHPSDTNKNEKRKIVYMGSPSDDEILDETQLKCLEPKAEEKEIVQKVDEEYDDDESKISDADSKEDSIDSSKHTLTTDRWTKPESKSNIPSAWNDELSETTRSATTSPREGENITQLYDTDTDTDSEIIFTPQTNKSLGGDKPFFKEYLKSYKENLEINKFFQSVIGYAGPTIEHYNVTGKYDKHTFRSVMNDYEAKVKSRQKNNDDEWATDRTHMTDFLIYYYKQKGELTSKRFDPENAVNSTNNYKQNKPVYIVIIFKLNQDKTIDYYFSDEQLLGGIDSNVIYRNYNLPKISENITLDKTVGEFAGTVVNPLVVDKQTESQSQENTTELAPETEYKFVPKKDFKTDTTMIVVEPYITFDNKLKPSFEYFYLQIKIKDEPLNHTIDSFYIKTGEIETLPDHRVLTVDDKAAITKRNNMVRQIQIGEGENVETRRIFGGAKKRRSKRKKSKSKNTTLRR